MNTDHASIPVQPATSPVLPSAQHTEMHARVRTHDWAATALGSADTWPQSLRTAVQTALDGGFPAIVLWGPQLVQIYNDGYRDLMGSKHPTGLGQSTQACWPEVWHLNAPIYARVWAGETITLEDALYPITRHGALEQAFFTLCYSPLRNEGDAVAGVLVTVFETTARLRAAAEREAVLQHTLDERVQTEIALRESEARFQRLFIQEQAARAAGEEANRLKDEFLATISHELRTPLTAVLGYAELLQRRTRDTAQVAHIAEKMVQSAKAQAALIEDLLDVGRITSGKLRLETEPIQLRSVIHAALDTVQPLIEAKELQLEVSLDPDGCVVLGDANRLEQVVWNLLSNAVKFTPAGGQITITLAQHGPNAEVRVSDTGHGIHPTFLPYVFDPFRQEDSSSRRSYSGLGLGLAIVQHLIELQGGTVTVTSAGEAQGATFTVQLPRYTIVQDGAEEHQVRETVKPANEPLLLHGQRVLVVDDQPAILDLLVEMLMMEGAAVRGCTNAPAALALVSAWQPHVLLSDIAMPEHDGYWLIAQLRQLTPAQGGTIPAIALTAYVRIEDQRQILAAGFQQYLSKPVSAAALHTVIMDIIPREQEE